MVYLEIYGCFRGGVWKHPLERPDNLKDSGKTLGVWGPSCVGVLPNVLPNPPLGGG